MYIIIASANTAGMSDELKGAIVTALVTGIISIIGFIVTNISMRRSFKNELIKQRDSIALEKMATLPFEVLTLMDRMIEAKNSRQQDSELKDFKKIMNEIYSYGSEKAISLVALMQKENYAANGDVNKMNKFRVMSSYVLLATQIKYDVTGTYVNPEFWFKMRITDYEKNKQEIRNANNNLVKELDLSKELKIS